MLRCAIYLASTGIVMFLAGRLLPYRWMKWENFPYRPYGFEREGSIYKKLGIQHWQSRLPDMSRIFPRLMPPKRMADTTKAGLRIMIAETCVAEFIHVLHGLCGFYCIRLWPGKGGAIMAAVNALLFNLPFMLIQRYNRPRLVRLYERLKKKENSNSICQP